MNRNPSRLPPLVSRDDAVLGLCSVVSISKPGGRECFQKDRVVLRPAQMVEILLCMTTPRPSALGRGPMRRKAELVCNRLNEPERELITRKIPDCRRVPASTEHLWCRSSVGRPTRQRMRRKERRTYELTPRCPSGPGKKSDRSDGSLVDPASSHMLVSKIKPCMSQCKPH
jgi:hypothetical protein